MSLQVENMDNNMAKITIEVTAEELEKALQKSYQKQRGKFAAPGFRKGKVPRQMVEKMYGPEVLYEEAVNTLIPDAYSKAYDESELDIVSQPQYDIVQIEKGKPFIFTAEVALKPDITLGEYKGLTVDKVSEEVTEDEVDAKIAAEQEKNARIISVEDRAVQDKDEVVFDFKGFVDGELFENGSAENHSLTIGSGSFIPGFEEQLIGAVIEQPLNVNVTFPEDYQATELAGKDAVFECVVHEIKAKEIPELDDDFASEVSEFDTLEEYKTDIKEKIKEQKIAEGKRKKEDQAINQAVENASLEIPEAMLETQINQMASDFAQRVQQQGISLEQYFQITNSDKESMIKELRPQAEKRIRTRLLLEAVVKAENIEISDEKAEEELVKMAESYQLEVDKLKELMGDQEIKQLKQDLAVQEAATLIAENAVEA
ncbi:MAG: trigger factor [Lachnospiraceae bacterium]